MDPVLVLNSGSSSVKFAMYEANTLLLHGELDRIGNAPVFAGTDAEGSHLQGPDLTRNPPRDPGAAALLLLPWLVKVAGRTPAVVGHRIVHGGAHRTAPERATPALLEELAALAPLAPLHQPHNLAPVQALLEQQPDLPQVLCFDTAFHRTQDPLAERFALPAALHDAGIRRYGFHGLSYESIAAALPAVAGRGLASGRVVAAHLGNGASLCAMRGGRSVATTMGFTALDGLPMGTRCGALDPGVVLYLIQERGMSPAEVERLLYYESGLKGVSGVSSDVRDLLASNLPSARLALDLYAHRIRRGIAEMAATLQGLDAVVFTGGVGRHQAPVRAAVCEGLAWLALELDPDANARHAARISTSSSKIAVFVVPDDESSIIAAAAYDLTCDTRGFGERRR
ncbi:MAG: acetate/propionate family kinase [Rhodospirillales bacterium]|nr:acetate/propionate family kinase [Rhodospirillales bacterium]